MTVQPTNFEPTNFDLPPTELACRDLHGRRVYVLIGGTETCEHGHHNEILSIGLRDNDSDDEIIARDDYREVIDLDPVDAIHLARALLNWATDIIDAKDDRDRDDDDST